MMLVGGGKKSLNFNYFPLLNIVCLRDIRVKQHRKIKLENSHIFFEEMHVHFALIT